jgi:hypothetical protein
MNIQTTKIELVKMILNIENSEFIKRLTDFIRENEKSDFWNDLSLADQQEIKQGIEDLDRGNRIEYKEFLKKIS